MSDTMSKSGLQVLEPRPRMSGQASATGSPNGIYEVNRSHGDAEWEIVTIESLGEGTGRLRLSTYVPADGTERFSGIGSDLNPFFHVQFISTKNQNEFVYASLIGEKLIVTYIYINHLDTLGKKMGDPTPQTGVWLGTSSGGQKPRVKA